MARLKNISRRLAAFLDLIAWSEGTAGKGDDGYNDIVDPAGLFDDYSRHPHLMVQVNPRLKSSAAGRYQLLARYADHYQRLLGLPDFSPESQDQIAIQQIRERRALADIEAGRIDQAISRCCNIWASFPGNDYAQRQHPMTTLLEQYQRLLEATP